MIPAHSRVVGPSLPRLRPWLFLALHSPLQAIRSCDEVPSIHQFQIGCIPSSLSLSYSYLYVLSHLDLKFGMLLTMSLDYAEEQGTLQMTALKISGFIQYLQQWPISFHILNVPFLALCAKTLPL